MYQTVSEATLKALQGIDGPSICNAIEGFNFRPKNQGFMLPEIRSIFQDFPPAVGYAVTGVISANQQEGHTVGREAWWDLIASVPEPRFIVLRDIDNPPLGAYWGEVQGNIHKALGAVGVITDGTVRDLDEVHALGFQFFAKEVSVSHAYVHLVDINIPVTIGGLTVNTGDLLHGDKHGVSHIPFELADRIPEMVQTIAEYEQKTISVCQSPNFTLEQLKEIAKITRPY
ncbi:MAG: RraA family protein [Chloroflexi bacterium]|nr:RraA family protein [Chloroflexota bacterium]MDA1217941.1 RraA family protein [Chloroflexota bacterium]